MSELHEVTANIRLHRLRRYVDGEIERWERERASLDGDNGIRQYRGYADGRIDALRNLQTFYLLTPEEASDAEAMRREMFG